MRKTSSTHPVGINATLPRLFRDVIDVCEDPRLEVDVRHLYRPTLPFLPSSPVLAYSQIRCELSGRRAELTKLANRRT